MKPLWAPWRMDYILGTEGRGQDCIFEAAQDKTSDRESLLLYRDAVTAVFMNRFPYANGHLLVAPARHVADIADLTAKEEGALMALIRESVAILRRHLAPHGMNVGLNLGEVAGAGIPGHLHFHVVPRWEGDHNFMTVLAEVRSIPEHIEATFRRLLPDFEALRAGGAPTP